MTIKFLYIVSFSFLVQLGAAQQTFTEKEFQDFVHVYMSFKNEKKRNGSLDKKYFDLHKVTKKRYREIATAALDNQPIILSPNENQLMADLKNQNRIVGESNEKLLQNICIQFTLPISQYDAILKKYKTDIQFQRSLKPHFDAYIKQLK